MWPNNNLFRNQFRDTFTKNCRIFSVWVFCSFKKDLYISGDSTHLLKVIICMEKIHKQDWEYDSSPSTLSLQLNQVGDVNMRTVLHVRWVTVLSSLSGSFPVNRVKTVCSSYGISIFLCYKLYMCNLFLFLTSGAPLQSKGLFFVSGDLRRTLCWFLCLGDLLFRRTLTWQGCISIFCSVFR